MKNINPIWCNYKEWEDYKNGMYESSCNNEMVMQCLEILTNNNLKEDMINTTMTYEISAKVNLTNKMFNPVS